MRSFGNRLGRETLLVVVAGAGTLLTGISGCRSSQQPTVVAVDNNGPDPSDANMAPVSEVNGGSQQSIYATDAPAQGSRRLLESPNGRVLEARMNGANQMQVQEYAGSAAPIERRAPQGVPAPSQGYYPNNGQTAAQGNPQNGGYGDQSAPEQDPSVWSDGEQDAYNQVTEEADAAPPPLPVYDQPPAPAPNYLWTPGYWNYATAGYYWVPGAWIAAPYAGALWTPGYWGAWHHHYGYHPGYWGRYVGFYGGISYGFGYFGSGYHGGYWRGNDFYYNQAVSRVNTVNIRNVYNRSVVVNNIVINHTLVNNRAGALNRVSYNGGTGGIQARPSRTEVAAFHAPRVAPMTAQVQNQRLAAENRQQFFKQNGGRPLIAAAPRPFAADRVAAPVAQRQEPGGDRAGQMISPQQRDARSGLAGLRSGQPGTQGQATEQQRGLYGNQGQQRTPQTQERAQQAGLQRSQVQQQQRLAEQQQRGQTRLQTNQPAIASSRSVEAVRQMTSQQSQGVTPGRQPQAVQDRHSFDRQQQLQVQQQRPVQENPAAAQQRTQFEQQRSQQLGQAQQGRAAEAQQQRSVQGNPAAVQQGHFAEQQQQRMQFEQQRSQQQVQQVQQQRAAQQAQQQRPVQDTLPAAQQGRFGQQQQQRMQFEQQRSQQQVQQVQQQRAAQQAQQQRPVQDTSPAAQQGRFGQQQQQRMQFEQQRSQQQVQQQRPNQAEQQRFQPQQPRSEAAPRQENRSAPQQGAERRGGGRQH